MATDEDLPKKVGRKLTKKKKPLRAASMHYPERLKSRDDENDDVTAPQGSDPKYMSQTVFGMIAAAGSKVDFHTRFEEESSDSDGGNESPAVVPVAGGHDIEHAFNINNEEEAERPPARAEPVGDAAKTADRRGLPPLPKLKLRTPREKNYLSQSISLPQKPSSSPRGRAISVTPRDAPVMSKMLEARAEMSPEELRSAANTDASESSVVLERKGSAISLATRLMEIFGFDGPEDVVSGMFKFHDGNSHTNYSTEYPCWLMDMVLLQGYMYVTRDHICFYSYLPKKDVS